MGVYTIRGLVAATLLVASSQFREVKSTPVVLEPTTDPRGNAVNSSTPSDRHQIPSQDLEDVEKRINDSEESVVNAGNNSYAVDDDTNNDYSGDFADYNDTYYEYDYDNDDYKNYELNDDDDDYDYEETNDDFDYNDENDDNDDNNEEYYDYDDNNDENDDSDDDNDENYDSDDENENYDSDDDSEIYDSDDENDYDDDYDDYDDTDSENQESPSNHHHHLITGQNGASIQVDDDGKVYMFLNVNETFDPSKYYLEVGNNTKLLLDLGGPLGNETADYELVKYHDLEGAGEHVKGTESSVTNRSYYSTNLTNDSDAKERSVVLLNVADAEDEGKGSNDNIANKDDSKNKKRKIFFGENDENNSNNSPGYEMITLTPGFPNDSDISVGWSSATISDDSDSTWPPEDLGDESSYWFEGTLSPTRNVLSELTTTSLYDFDGQDDDDYSLGEDEPEEDVQKSILDMSDEELQEFIETYPELIESDNEEFEGNETEPEMTTSALMFGQHRDVIENFNGSESLSTGNRAVLEEEEMDPGAESGLTWLLIPAQSGNSTHKPTNNTDIDYSQIHQEFVSSNNLTDEEQLELGGLERLRRTTEALGGLSALRKDSANHHIVRRQLSSTEACGSFSRRRRDTGSKDVVNAEGQRYKRGVSNVGRRLEMGNPAFRQLYNQYKNMCNFIAMVAFEK